MIHERRSFMNNDDKIKEQMKSEPVPEELRPENIKTMLDNEVSKKKRSGISMSRRIAAAAAACTVVCGTAVYAVNTRKNNIKTSEPVQKNNSTSTTVGGNSSVEVKELKSYMSGASDYKEVYTMFRKAAKKAERERAKYRYKESIVEEAVPADEVYNESATMAAGGIDDAENGSLSGDNYANITEQPIAVNSTDEADTQHSETYNQEQNVLEADIVKTDGKHIYYLGSQMKDDGYYTTTPVLRTADVDNGSFTGSSTLDITSSLFEDDGIHELTPVDMYVYNDMIAVICDDFHLSDNYDTEENYVRNSSTVVAFYTTGDEPQLIDVYTQDGTYNDVRISADGYMLLTSSFTTPSFDNIDDSDDTRSYVPCCGFTECYDILPADDILLPVNGFNTSEYLTYSVIGSIDLNESGAPTEKDSKTLAGYTGSIYCSADNLYTAAWSEYNKSDITRISITGGDIVPMAGTTIEGTVKDQFSMSEYDGYFRVAATYTEIFHKSDDIDDLGDIWEYIIEGGEKGSRTYEYGTPDTRVYVLDMDLNMVGSIGGLGVNEQLKSASFSGNTAYVVTFRQTDPLYAVDLSVPESPVLLDEFKINGFSTYMQSWTDGLLLGFGFDADDNGSMNGLRMTMFNNSDPENLSAEDIYTWNNFEEYNTSDDGREHWSYESYGSNANYERKALLIAPEKNLIGVPILHDFRDEYHETLETRYDFFSFEDGKFVFKGSISADCGTQLEKWNISHFDRAVFIGDYVYALSSGRFVAADINTIEVTDELVF